ncbi:MULTISPECIES: TonB-dependent receptor [Paraburkholderia]|uniref:TonB-dependent receptor n=1 Tax=Paraburkholderia TaxID=1822464 RepID=UPI0022588B3F|nr:MULTISPECIES: TonB-dependent receptor [Paraburkholderia]MCX4161779.1 TonB-dependent receptor [Paraburkholderia megapolitana]MDN7157276.1 TonB-dependent receptor [Paraburkholderia sp. CHISQ3]MDQ6494321.1 TonB-dependent receptor [Paraburkholderia megapolitana]
MKIRKHKEKWLVPACFAIALTAQAEPLSRQDPDTDTDETAASEQDRTAAARSKRTAPASTEDSTFVLGAIEVSAVRTGPLSTRNILSSVDRVEASHIENQNVRSPWELFGQMPGVLLTDFNQGTTSGKISFRGFNGESEINAVKLLIDGIPSNSNDGSMPFMDAVFPLEIESLETVRGTNDPRYGLHNIAGNATITTLNGGNYAKGRVGYGSYSTYNAEAVAGHESDTFSQNYAFGYRRSQGYRDHSDMDKVGVAGKWFYSPSAAVRLGLSARYGRTAADEPGYLTQADAHGNPTGSYAFNNTDQATRETGQYAAYFDVDLTDRLSSSSKAYFNTYRDRRWVRFSASVSQQERFSDEQQLGFLSSLTYRPHTTGLPWIKDLALEAGVSGEWQNNRSQRWLTRDQVRTSQTRDQTFSYDTTGAYVQATFKPFDTLKLIPAYRVDMASGHLTNHLSGQRYDMNDYGVIQQPKFSAVYTPWSGYSFYGNYGRTFQIGVGAGAYKIPPRVTDLAPSVNDGWEVGLKFSPFERLDGRVAYWEQTASNEVRRKANDPTGDFDNLGKTKRKGFDVQANLLLARDLSVWFAYTYQMACIVDPGPTSLGSAGKQVDHVPNHLVSAGADYQATPDLRLSTWGNAQSAYYLEPTNSTGKFGSSVRLNASASYRFSKAVTLDVQLTNLLNRYNEYVWYDGTQTLHSPAAGRAAFASLTMSY